MTITVAVDAMGGDVGLKVTVPASLRFLEEHPEARLILVGDSQAIEAELSEQASAARDRLDIRHASQVVDMDEPPQLALKNKKDSSMRVAINLVKDGEAQAAVSAGNTGALMATARFVLKTIPGIDRPAIAKLLPTVEGRDTCMLDLGANVDCTPEQLLQFGIMGSELVSCIAGRENPRVGLLNIGSEDIKGNESVKRASVLLKESGLNFYGNVEGDDVYRGKVDVVVCDGFTGNVALKTSEGVAHMVVMFMRREFSRTWWTRLCALMAMSVLKRFRNSLDPRRYNGASFLGLKGTVVKSHGGTDALGFGFALHQAWEEARSNVIGHITDRVVLQMANLKSPVTEAN
ncbi:phosphate acyltransferase PlsX [Paludibacterium purpuratum]|uniref:Phosphate acyltransferase n=1 Tax=Paludibacterium purpuratum TaxID=1144873 RepID=A0A4R7BCY4_9NEIS|nr:phosphate acyltransferase PlsX [Paludibacterium purpuratum]TDR82818.1 phosphate:acyl-[acyl carrier protein] acyltransferase [Paludibacterium purpuratum]